MTGSIVHPEVLFCSEQIAERHGERFRSILPALEIVALTEQVDPADVARLTIAFASTDTYPERSAPFMRVALDAPRLRWLHSFSAGVDHPVFGMFRDRGVTVTTSSGATAPAIAETALMYLLALTRRLPDWFDAQRRHAWERHGIAELGGMPVVVLGMGPIGRRVIELARAVGMDAVGVRRAVVGDEPCPTFALSDIDHALATLAGRPGAVVVALPLTDSTRDLLDATRIAALPAGSLIVNVGRGEIIDEDALVDALARGHLGGAGLDVFVTEPLGPDHRLWDLDNVIITPHSSGVSEASAERVVEIFCDNLGRYAAGRPLRNQAEY